MNLTQEELAIKSGLDRTTINRYENDLVDHSLGSINMICKALKINPSNIYDDYLNFIAGDYGNKIKSIRIKLKLTQKDFGNLLEVHKKTITSWEKEITYPTRENFKKVILLNGYF